MKRDLDSIVGSRVVEISYVSPPDVIDDSPNRVIVGQRQIELSCCSRVVEIDYVSPSS